MNAKGEIRDMGLLDLRSAKSAEDLAGISSIKDVGAVLIPDFLVSELTKIDISDVGSIIPIPHGTKVNCMVGEVTLNAATLVNGDPETTLLIAGQAFIEGEVNTIGYKEIQVFGQLFASRKSQQAIGAKLTQMTGQNFYLPDDPRFVRGHMDIGNEFLELLPGPTAFVVMGSLRFEPGVTKEAIKSKITEIVLMGEIKAPRELLPLLEVITKEKMGQIVADE